MTETLEKEIEETQAIINKDELLKKVTEINDSRILSIDWSYNSVSRDMRVTVYLRHKFTSPKEFESFLSRHQITTEYKWTLNDGYATRKDKTTMYFYGLDHEDQEIEI